MHFERLKSTRISLKSVFSAFRRKPSRSAHDAWNAQIQRAWQFLQASIFRQGLWSWLLFIKWRPLSTINKLKPLFRFLTITDLLVGLISQPFYVVFLVSLIPKINMDHVAVIRRNVFFSMLPRVSILWCRLP